GEFKLISSWFPLGSACVVTGQLNNENGQLELITSLHIAFRALFIIWLLTMSVLFVIGHMSTNELTSWLTEVIGLLIGATLFRLFIHSAYARARNKFISQLSEILDLNKRDV
ncbi:hypothetical protein, partial [Fulvivirga sp.]